MKKFLLAIAILVSIPSFSQIDRVKFDTAKALLSRMEDVKALPVLQELMRTATPAEQRMLVNYIAESWLDVRTGIALSRVNSEYHKILADYMKANLTGKKMNEMSAADNYTAGIVYWAFGFAGGSVEQKRFAYTNLDLAVKAGNTNATFYFAQVVHSLKANFPSVSWPEIIDLYTKATVAKKSPQPLIHLARSAVGDMRGNPPQTKKDTAATIFWNCLNNLAQALPDSFYKVVDYFWQDALSAQVQDWTLTDLLTSFFTNYPIPNYSKARKGQAWNYLEYFFYDSRPMTDAQRYEVFKMLKAYYKDERDLLGAISQFLTTASEPNIQYFARATNTKWIDQFTPSRISDPVNFFEPLVNPVTFFKAAAKSEQNYIGFLEKNPLSPAIAQGIAEGYKEKMDILGYMVLGDQPIKDRNNIATQASLTNRAVMDKLPAEIRNFPGVKQAYADMTVLGILVELKAAMVPRSFLGLADLYNSYSSADKKGYDTKWLKYLLQNVEQLLFLSKGNVQKEILNDQAKSQAALDRIKKMFGMN